MSNLSEFKALPKNKQEEIMLFLGVYDIEDVPTDWKGLLGLTSTGKKILLP